MLLVGVGAQAATNDGHVWLKLQSSNVRMDEAVNHFGEWINLPAESTFELLSDETDQIGMRHLRYRQYVALIFIMLPFTFRLNISSVQPS